LITPYAANSPNVVKIWLALEELGLAYEAVPIDVMAGHSLSDDFKSPRSRRSSISWR
jgi:GST-like protein